MKYNIATIALAAACSHGHGDLTEKYVRRLRHLCAEGVFNVTRDGEGGRAEQLFSTDETCLASLMLFVGEVLNFDVHLQGAIVRGARSIRQGEGLRQAVEGVALGEPWALSIKLRHPFGGERIAARFVRYDAARPNEGAEELLAAYGEPLTGTVILPLKELFEPFAQHAKA